MRVANTLLIDDDAEFSDSTKALFDYDKLRVDYANNWEEGLDLFLVGSHELVIADYNLPNSKMGLKLLATIKQLRPSSKLILISGQFVVDPEPLLKDSKIIDRYLPKDAQLGELLIEEVKEANVRASSNTNWADVANAQLKSNEVDEQEIERIDQVLRQQLVK